MFKLAKCIFFTQLSFWMKNQIQIHLQTNYIFFQKITKNMIKYFEITQVTKIHWVKFFKDKKMDICLAWRLSRVGSAKRRIIMTLKKMIDKEITTLWWVNNNNGFKEVATLRWKQTKTSERDWRQPSKNVSERREDHKTGSYSGLIKNRSFFVR